MADLTKPNMRGSGPDLEGDIFIIHRPSMGVGGAGGKKGGKGETRVAKG